MSARRFAKYEGLGNDFLVLDAREWSEEIVTPALAVALCDRHRGVGGDGILWVDASRAPASARMVIYNSDGSRPEMCGNGVRCVAAWLADEGRIPSGATVTIESDAGPRPATLRDHADGAASVEVSMGVATLSDARPSVEVGGVAQSVYVVDVGNPHGVLFDPRGESMELVQGVTGLKEFPQGVNVELVTVTGENALRVRVHERGVGWTQACGTGACAVVAAAVRRGLVRAGAATRVTLDGGDLEITVSEAEGRVTMRGPARRVFTGAW
jgi:diaminopimelate epimerase